MRSLGTGSIGSVRILMSVVAKLLSALAAVGRLLTASGTPKPAVAEPAVAVQAPTGTAVAGYVRRLVVDRFYLASRISSVARLNTPVGRKPRTSPRPSLKPAVPVERLGAKKVRAGTSGGLRVLPMIEARRGRGAEIIPFPMQRTKASTGAVGLKRAA